MQGLPGQVLPKTETETKPRHVQLSSVPLNPMTPIPSQRRPSSAYEKKPWRALPPSPVW